MQACPGRHQVPRVAEAKTVRVVQSERAVSRPRFGWAVVSWVWQAAVVRLIESGADHVDSSMLGLIFNLDGRIRLVWQFVPNFVAT